MIVKDIFFVELEGMSCHLSYEFFLLRMNASVIQRVLRLVIGMSIFSGL